MSVRRISSNGSASTWLAAGCSKPPTTSRQLLSTADLDPCAAWIAPSRELLACHRQNSGRASRPTEIVNVALQCRLCHFPPIDATRLHRPAASPCAAACVGDTYYRQVGGSRTERLRSRPRADAHFRDLSAA